MCIRDRPYAARRGSPVALSRISFLNWGYDPAYPTVGYAFAFFAAVCAALAFAAMKLGKRVDLEALSFQDGGGAVSYTHLDVYKRQIFLRDLKL